MKQSIVQVDSYGVAVNDVGTTDTAIPQRDSVMKLQYQTYWKRSPPPSLEKTKPIDRYNRFQDWMHLLWINQMFKDVYSETGIQEYLILITRQLRVGKLMELLHYTCTLVPIPHPPYLLIEPLTVVITTTLMMR